MLSALRGLARHVDAFAVTSRYYRRHMARLLSLDAARIHVLPLGVDPAPFEPPQPPAGAPRSARPPAVGYLARLWRKKGLGLLVDAFSLLSRRLEGVELHLAGWLARADQGYLDAQRRRLEAAGLGDRLRLQVDVDLQAKVRFLRSVDVVSVPTLYPESKGLYALEALAAGVPVVMPDHGALPELLARTGGGRLVPPGDPDALAGALHDLLLDDEARRELGARGRAGVLATSSAVHATDALLELYRALD